MSHDKQMFDGESNLDKIYEDGSSELPVQSDTNSINRQIKNINENLKHLNEVHQVIKREAHQIGK